MASGNTVSQSGVTRWDGGAASGRNMTVDQADTQDLYDAKGGGRFNPSYYTSRNYTTTAPTSDSGAITAAALAAIAAAQRGSGSSSTANNNAYNLGMAELAYKKKSDASADATALEALLYGRNKDARILGGMENFYNTGSYGKGFDKLLGMIDTQGKVSEKGVTDAYGRAVTNINEGYGAAQGLGDAGYAALNQYLGQNPNNPYAGMQASVGSAPDALTQYLSSYGVSDQPVQGQIQADQLQAQQGAGNYQNLIDILSGVAQSGASSRGAESAMGQNLFNTSLGQEQAGYKGAANNAQAQALAALQQQMFQSRFGVENDRNSLANQLAQQIIAAGGAVGAPVAGAPVAGAPVAGAPVAGAPVAGAPVAGAPVAPSTSYDVNRPVATDLQNQLANLAAPAQALGLTAQQLLDQLNERRGYVQQQPTYQPLASMTTVQSPQIQALLQQIAAQQVAGNSSDGGRGNYMDMF